MEPLTLVPSDCSALRQGTLGDDGSFSFWDRGEVEAWFVSLGTAPVELTLTVRGHTVAGEPPVLAVERLSEQGVPVRIAALRITSSQAAPYTLSVPVSTPFFGIRLCHTNRVADPERRDMRHLLLDAIRVQGARRAPCGPLEYGFYHDARRRPEAPPATPPTGTVIRLDTEHLTLSLDPTTGTGFISRTPGNTHLVQAFVPCLVADPPSPPLAEYTVASRLADVVDPVLGACREVVLQYRREGALSLTYTVRVSLANPELSVRLGCRNDTGADVVMARMAPFVAAGVTLGSSVTDTLVIGDAKTFAEPYTQAVAAEVQQFESWWYMALKDRNSGRSLLLGSLTNSKGLGRLLVLPESDSSVRLAGYSDYEGIIMPPGAEIPGETWLFHLGRRGGDSLERFGEALAKANGIDLRRDHPLDPYGPEGLALFTTWNSYGAAVVRGFDYKHDRTRGDNAYEDPEWCRRNREEVARLGLADYGYGLPAKVRGTPSPLARRYGTPDFWFKEAKEIHAAHPEYYIGERIDFSNPAVIAFETQRAQAALQDPDHTMRYSWDFTDLWSYLPGQYDPFQTSAETYRTAMGIWRDAGRAHPRGAYAFVWMNIVGINYDRCDVIHIGADSDQGYYGPGCTFTQGLTRQISGRYFYNGRAWWNSPDSFHVYCGGLYSFEQAKVHASFCAIAGNLVHLGEPFADEEIPEDRLDIIRRVSPTTADVAAAVDVFESNPARLWNMRIERPFAAWNVVGLFNVDYGQSGESITHEIRLADLGLDENRSYLVYEFWSRRFLGSVKGSFTRTLAAPDCGVFAVVEAADRPVLLSTSRHVRHMAYDVRSLAWDAPRYTLHGTSRVVAHDPYQLRIHVPPGWQVESCQVEDGIAVRADTDGPLLLLDVVPDADRDLDWQVVFSRTAGAAPAHR